jgi:hypothetical protein
MLSPFELQGLLLPELISPFRSQVALIGLFIQLGCFLGYCVLLAVFVYRVYVLSTLSSHSRLLIPLNHQPKPLPSPALPLQPLPSRPPQHLLCRSHP